MANHTFYLCFKRRQRGFGSLSVRCADKEPSLAAGEVSVRVTADLPDVLFTRPMLSAKITVPKDRVSPPTIAAEVAANIGKIVQQQLGVDLRITIEDAERQ